MSELRYATSMSLDGFVAGRDQSTDNPLGVHGERLHLWMRELAVWRAQAGFEGGVTNASTEVLEDEDVNVGSIIMGRNMFGGGSGPWAPTPWNGWWGDDPPFHLPVVVLTHHARTPLVCDGGTTFYFVTDGIEAALSIAREHAKGLDVVISGGANVAQQYISAGLVDQLMIHLVPVILGDGVRLFDRVDPSINIAPAGVIEAPGVTHLTYRLSRAT